MKVIVHRHRCDVCGKRFKLKGDRDRHYVVHTGEKPFGCDICKKFFSFKCNLKSHLKIHNQDTAAGIQVGSNVVDCCPQAMGRQDPTPTDSHTQVEEDSRIQQGGGPHSKEKRAKRTRFTDYQIKVLQEFFDDNPHPKDDDLDYLTKLLSLSPRVISVWFQNARQKARRKIYENQPPLDSNEDGGQNRRQTGQQHLQHTGNPPSTFEELIGMAIRSSPEMRSTAQEICQFITENFPEYRESKAKLETSITDHLRNLPHFVLAQVELKCGEDGINRQRYYTFRPVDDIIHEYEENCSVFL